MPLPSAPPAITALRQATAASHEAIEDLLRLDEHVTPARLAVILTGFDQFLAAWEPRVLAALPPRLQPWFLARSRRPFLHEDLQHLGLPRAHGHPAAAHVPALGSLAAAFGSLYVLEGSALGGQVISRRLADRLGHGSAYFHGWGDQTGRLWREFRDTLEAEVGPDPAGHAVAADAAVRTFEGLARTFQAVVHDDARIT